MPRRTRLRCLLLLPVLASLGAAGQPPLRPGKVTVYHYASDLDNTKQPFSVWLPRAYTPAKKWPLWIQLHGLGGGHRMGGARRENADGIVVSPDGRGSTDYKLWGEDDVVRVVLECKKLFSVDDDRVYLYGFSMGGSGAWQVGVHYPGLFAALGPVCGNADHRVWEELWDWAEKDPTWMSPRKRWVEATESAAFFAENLINLPAFACHGTKDNVVPVGHARSMVAAIRRHGGVVVYDENPDAGHGIPGDMVAGMLNWMKEHRRNPWPERVVFKTAWRRHPGAYWVRVRRFQRAFAFARIEAEVKAPNAIHVQTDNLEEFSLHLVPPLVRAGRPVRVVVDGRQHFSGSVPKGGWLSLRKFGDAWRPSEEPTSLHKTPTLEGPVYHAFMSSFIIVYGTGGGDRAKRVALDEARILADRWNRWARGRSRLKADRDVTPEDIQSASLILVGDVANNSLIPRVMDKLPIQVQGNTIRFNDRRWEGDDLGLKLIYPNPLNPQRYVVLFTGTTWRGVYQVVGRFGNWFDWGILDGWHWQDFAVFDDRTYSPETFLAVGYFDNDWRLNPNWFVLGHEEQRLARPPRRTPPLRKPPPDAGQIYLSDLEPVFARIEKGAVQRDRSFNAHPITLGGRTYERGLGVHTNCDLGFDLGGQFGTFEAVVGTDLEGADAVSPARARAESFEFMVIGDGRMLYKTGRMRWNSEPRHIYVPIQGVRRLELKVHRRSGARWLSGPLDWAIARVGEPIHNRVAVNPRPKEPERLVEAIPLDGQWKLVSFEVGSGLRLQAHHGDPAAWRDAIPATVPASLFAALAEAGRDDLRPDAVRREWWYSRSFRAPAAWAGRSVWVELDGAAYVADCWLNGRWIGRVLGPFAAGRFEATRGLMVGKRNTLAVRVVAAPAPLAKSDKPFRPAPPGKLVTSQHLARSGYPPLGLWRSVRVKAAGPCLLRNLHVETVALTEDAARLRVAADVTSVVKEKVTVILTGSIGGHGFDIEPLSFEKKLELDGGKTARVELEIPLPKPKLWWPWELGGQPLYEVAAGLWTADGVLSDEAALRFGVRTVAFDTSSPVARLRINGQKGLAVRGIVWTPADPFLRVDVARIQHLLARARGCRLNALRVWGGGLAESDAFYDLCDRLGFLVIQEFPLASEAQRRIAGDYLRNAEAIVARLRSRPSLVAWAIGGGVKGNEPANPPLARAAAALCDRLDPRRPCILESPRAGTARVWTTRTDPALRRTYWRSAAIHYVGGVPSPPAYRTLSRFLGGPPAWPSTEPWARAARSAAVVALGRSGSAAELILKAQAAQAAALQQAVERRRLGGASHVVWQLAESLPSSSPALIDAAGRPKAAYYALRRASGPLAILADFGGKAPTALSPRETLAAEVCVRSDAATLRGATVRAEVFDSSMRRLGAWRRSLDVPRGVLARPLALHWRPHPSLVGDVCFLRLRLDDRAGRTLASNLYWFGIVRPPAREAEPRLRVAWLAAKPSGPLADAAFLAAARIEVSRPERPQPEAPESVMQDEEDVPDEELTDQDWVTPPLPPIALDGYDVIVVDAATVLDEYTEDDLRAVAAAVARGSGLLIVGLNDDLLLSALAPLLPVGEQAELPSGIARRPVAVVPQHPALAGLSLATCALLPRRPATALRGDAKALAQFDADHPFLAEMSHGSDRTLAGRTLAGRVLALATVPGGRLADWPQIRAFYARLLGYLGRLPADEFAALADAADAAPLRALGRLGAATVEAVARQEGETIAVRLTNTSDRLAFMVHLDAAPHGDAGEAALSALDLSDNYLALFPGETRTIRVDAARGVEGRPPRAVFDLILRGLNLAPRRLAQRLVLHRGRVSLR